VSTRNACWHSTAACRRCLRKVMLATTAAQRPRLHLAAHIQIRRAAPVDANHLVVCFWTSCICAVESPSASPRVRFQPPQLLSFMFVPCSPPLSVIIIMMASRRLPPRERLGVERTWKLLVPRTYMHVPCIEHRRRLSTLAAREHIP